MKPQHANIKSLGEFEQAVLRAIMCLRSDAYGTPIRKDVSDRLRKPVSVGALYVTLDRLESKGYVSSRTGEPTPERGGRSKRYYKVTALGRKALNVTAERLREIWNLSFTPGVSG